MLILVGAVALPVAQRLTLRRASGTPECSQLAEVVIEMTAALRGRDAGGTGMGLPVMRQMFEPQGASVRLLDAPGAVCRISFDQ